MTVNLGEDWRVVVEQVHTAIRAFIDTYNLEARTAMWVSLPDTPLGGEVARRVRAPHVPRYSERATNDTRTSGEFTFYVVPIGWDGLHMRLARAGLALPPGVSGEGILPGR